MGTIVLLGALALVSGAGSEDNQPTSPQATSSAGDLADLTGLRAGPASDVHPATSTDGLPPVVSRVTTTDRVVFITIDDGTVADPKVADLLSTTGIPVTPFLTANVTSRSRGYFSKIRDLTGQTIQNHTMDHPHLSGLSEANQRKQICPASDDYQTWFGARPWIFRPPYGEYSRTTRQAAADCGIKYLVDWSATLPGPQLQTTTGGKLRPGDIIVAHWTPDLAGNLPSLLKKIKDQHFKVGALQDYLPAT